MTSIKYFFDQIYYWKIDTHVGINCIKSSGQNIVNRKIK